MSLHPFHSDRGILNPAGLAGVLTVLHLCMDLKNTLLGKCHYMLFYITAAMNPRMLMTVRAVVLVSLLLCDVVKSYYLELRRGQKYCFSLSVGVVFV